MKLVTFTTQDRTAAGALVTRDGVEQIIDLHRADSSLPETLIGLLALGDAGLARAQNAAQAALPEAIIARDSAKLLAPIPRPGKIICIGLNYRDHATESNLDIQKFPVVFAKWANCVIGPDEPIVLPRVSNEVDYEAELAVVMRNCPRYVAEADALRYVAGYVPFHDVSARDWQMRTSQWTMGKTPDTFGPMGPVLVTADEIPDPQTLDIQLTINGEVLQHSNTKHLIFTVQQLIADLTQVMTLEAGDIISTGTPAGVGAARTPKRFLKAGDVVSITIEKLGTLSNPVVAES